MIKDLKKEFGLFDHQVEGIKFLIDKRKAILAHDMGLGKTRQAIIASGIDGDKSILVVCPASLKINWQREIAMVYPEDITRVLTTTDHVKANLIYTVSWFIINYDILEKKKGYILDLIDEGIIDTVILDEAHYIKGKSTRADAALEITKNAKRVYCLTGTPIMNRPVELFNLLKAIGHPLGKARTTFIKRYCGGELKIMVKDLQSGKMFFTNYRQSFMYRHNKKKYKVFMFNDDTGATRLPELHKFTEDVILRKKKDDVGLNLPEKIISVHMCEFSEKDKKMYDTAWDRYVEWVGNNPTGKNIENIINAQQLVEIGKLKQVCSMAKCDTIISDVLNAIEQGQKILIFSQYKDTVNYLKEELIKAKIGVVSLTGEDDSEDRQKAVDTFQEDENVKVMVLNIKAGGVGLNLTKANMVIFADMEWSPETHNQCMDRAHRIGQTGTVNVYYYVTKDSIEEDNIEILGIKEIIIDQIIEGKNVKIVTISDILKKINKRLESKLSTD